MQAAELAWCTTGILLRRRMSAFGTKQTLGQFHDTPFHCALAEMGPSRIMFSVDYPYEEMAPAAAWFNKTELSDRSNPHRARERYQSRSNSASVETCGGSSHHLAFFALRKELLLAHSGHHDVPNYVRFRGNSGHPPDLAECLLLTQSGHERPGIIAAQT